MISHCILRTNSEAWGRAFRRSCLAIFLFMQPATAQIAGMPVVPEGGEDTDACPGVGVVDGLDPFGDGYLAVRSAPNGREVDRVYNGQRLYLCMPKGNWEGVVYPSASQTPEQCGVNSTWPAGVPYSGPCKFGWVYKRYVKVIAG